MAHKKIDNDFILGWFTSVYALKLQKKRIDQTGGPRFFVQKMGIKEYSWNRVSIVGTKVRCTTWEKNYEVVHSTNKKSHRSSVAFALNAPPLGLEPRILGDWLPKPYNVSVF